VALTVLVLVLALTPLDLLGLTIGVVLALMLPLINPVFGLFWAVLSVPVQEVVVLPGGVTYTQAAVALAAAAWVLHKLLRLPPEGSTEPSGPTSNSMARLSHIWWQCTLWIGLLWSLLLSTSLTAYSTTEGLKETARWTIAALIWLIAVTSVTRRWERAGLLVCLLLAPALTALLGLWQFAAGSGPASFRITAEYIFVRAHGTIGQPNSFAGYLNMAWPLAWALAVAFTWMWILDWRINRASTLQHTTSNMQANRPSNIHNPKPTIPRGVWFAITAGLWLVAGLLLAGLVASFSRGGWIGAFAGFIAMGLALLIPTAADRSPHVQQVPPLVRRPPTGWKGHMTSNVRRVFMLAAVIVVAGAIGWQVLPAPVEARILSVARSLTFFDPATAEVTAENYAVVERMAQLQAGWRMFTTHPLTGVGPGSYTRAYPDVAVAPWYVSKGHAHNYYLHIAAEAGLLGLLAYFALVGGVSYTAITRLRHANSTVGRSIAVGCCGIITAVLVHNLFENLHVLNLGIQLSTIWALSAIWLDT
jgi:O-antigen ligase